MAIQDQQVQLLAEIAELKSGIAVERSEVSARIEELVVAVNAVQAQLDELSVDSPDLALAIAEVQSAKAAVAAIYEKQEVEA